MPVNLSSFSPDVLITLVTVITNPVKQSPSWEADSRSATEILCFMESESSLQCSDPNSGIYAEPDESIPRPQALYVRSVLTPSYEAYVSAVFSYIHVSF